MSLRTAPAAECLVASAEARHALSEELNPGSYPVMLKEMVEARPHC